MENFELIEKYVNGQLQGQEKEAFEAQMHADPTLKGDVAFQQQIIEGVKKARATQLKAMLNQVPIGSLQTGASATQFVLGVVTTVAVITASVFYFKPWKNDTKQPIVEEKTIAPVVTEEKKPNDNAPVVQQESTTSSAKAEVRKEKAKIKVSPTPSRTAQPKIEVIDPTDEMTQPQTDGAVKVEKNQSTVAASHIAVETDDSKSAYSFHYQFTNGKLILYGSFDKGLYEILEVHGETHSVFLYYKDAYYLLNEKQTEITPLSPIKDLQLIKKLKEYRSK